MASRWIVVWNHKSQDPEAPGGVPVGPFPTKAEAEEWAADADRRYPILRHKVVRGEVEPR